MRLLIVSQLYPRRDAPLFGSFIERQVRALRAAGVDVTVVAPIMRAPWFTWWRPRWRALAQVSVSSCASGVMVYHPRYWSPPGMRFFIVEGDTLRWGIESLCERLHAEKPFDIIHANRVFPDAYAALGLARRWNTPLVAMARGMDLNQLPARGRLYRRALRHVIGRADITLSVSRGLLDGAVAFGARPRHAAVVYNGCDIDETPAEPAALRKKHGLPAKGKLVLFVGRLEPDKGTPELLRALGALARRRGDFHLVAVGALRNPAYRQDVARAGWSTRVHFLGERPHGAVQEIMRACDIFAFPSRREGVPNVVLEAMGHGLPVVASRAGGIPEIVPAEAGFLAEVGDVRALELHIGRLLDDAALRRRMGAAGRRAAQQYTWVENARKLIAHYENLLSARRPAARQAIAA